MADALNASQQLAEFTKIDGIEGIPFTESEISDIVVTHGRK
jgi:hypothetical protein